MTESRLPLFPLPNVVLFPNMVLPLHIFEPRYREMMRDVLAGDKRFGIQLCQEYNPETRIGIPFDVGTVAEIVEHDILDDGRMNILVIGGSRFRVQKYDDESKPYLMGDVTWVEDERDGYVTKKLVTETVALFLDAIRMTHKILHKEFKGLELPVSPDEISFFIAENLRGSLVLKQELLETTSVKARLSFEREVLQKMVKSLAVRTQIEEAFRTITDSETPDPEAD